MNLVFIRCTGSPQYHITDYRDKFVKAGTASPTGFGFYLENSIFTVRLRKPTLKSYEASYNLPYNQRCPVLITAHMQHDNIYTKNINQPDLLDWSDTAF